eukprot:scaffold34515_cov61-Phaeocystis_antarctica.AAC.2
MLDGWIFANAPPPGAAAKLSGRGSHEVETRDSPCDSGWPWAAWLTSTVSAERAIAFRGPRTGSLLTPPDLTVATSGNGSIRSAERKNVACAKLGTAALCWAMTASAAWRPSDCCARSVDSSPISSS